MAPEYIDHSNGGAVVDIDEDRAPWLLSQGYISEVKTPKDADEERGRYATSPPADEDPTLAQNREKPVGVADMEPHLANDGDEGDTGETILGNDRGLDAEVRPGAPEAQFKPSGDELDALDYDELKERVKARREAEGDEYDGPALNASAVDLKVYLRG